MDEPHTASGTKNRVVRVNGEKRLHGLVSKKRPAREHKKGVKIKQQNIINGINQLFCLVKHRSRSKKMTLRDPAVGRLRNLNSKFETVSSNEKWNFSSKTAMVYYVSFPKFICAYIQMY